MAKKPIIGITMGDPAGNGSEISVKALADSSVYERCRPIIIGDANCMEKAVKILGKENEIKIHAVQDVKEAIFEFGTIDVYDIGRYEKAYVRKSIKNVRRSSFSICCESN